MSHWANVPHEAQNSNVTAEIECAVECTCAAGKARQLSYWTFHYPTTLRRKINGTPKFKTTKLFACLSDVCTLSS
jgi:hypothetical protein